MTVSLPQSVAVDNDGVLWIVDYENSRVRRVGKDGIIATVAGTGAGGFGGDGGPAIGAEFDQPLAIAGCATGELCASDFGNHARSPVPAGLPHHRGHSVRPRRRTVRRYGARLRQALGGHPHASAVPPPVGWSGLCDGPPLVLP
ncbi:hypothetical protein ACFC09_34765 [Streptomyces sp. NPDC056161]|uniref:hypothetical protein n=1 Tax=Streptomyces sp. NPDC056161 TaxID=3345732 RepID=UPI0035E02B5E